MSPNERSSASATASSDTASAPSSRYSSGPSHSVARAFSYMARHGSSANAAPQTGAAAARARASPCRTKRIAGGIARIHAVAGTGGRLRVATSGIDAGSGRIVENRCGDFDLQVTVWHGYVEGLPETRTAARNQAQGNRMAQHAARMRRGDVTDQFHGWFLARPGRDLCSFVEHGVRILGTQTHQLLAGGCLHRGPFQRALAHEIRLAL